MAFARIECGELFEGAVQPDQIKLLLHGDAERIVEWDMDSRAAPFLRATPPRVIYQDTPHHARRDREEVSAILPLRFVLAAEPKVDFMN